MARTVIVEESPLASGIDFLRAQVTEAAGLHTALLESMIYHESEANDSRYRDLCDRHLPRMREHQLMLEDLRVTLGTSDTRASLRTIPRALADAATSDYHRLVADLDLARRLEVTFKTFRDAGRTLRIEPLARLGEMAERHHDDYSADAKRLLLQMFIERADGATEVVRLAAVDSRADSRIR
jgi:hypothetical protein